MFSHMVYLDIRIANAKIFIRLMKVLIFYHHYKEDIAEFGEMGFKVYRTKYSVDEAVSYRGGRPAK